MTISWELITESLRSELQEYGALLGLFEEQQANLLRRDADQVLALASNIEQQAQQAHLARSRREQCVGAFAIAHDQPVDVTLRQLLPFFPAEVQPLLQALMDEINHLIHRIRRDARQNQLMLSRTVEAHTEALRELRPDSFESARTYSPRGEIGLGTTSAWKAAG